MMKRLSILSVLLTLAGSALAGSLSLLGAGGAGGGGGSSYVGFGDLSLSGGTIVAYWGLQGYNGAYSGNAANICLPSAGTCYDVPIVSGQISLPGGLSTCNNSTVICTIKILYDQSGALSCLNGATPVACDFIQATEANRPTLVVAGAANGCPSTLYPCIHALHSASQLWTTAYNLTAAQPLNTEAVGTSVNQTAPFISNANGTTTLFTLSFNIIDYLEIDAGTGQIWTSSPYTTNGSPHAMQATINGATSVINSDGGTSGNLNAGTNTFTGQPIIGLGDYTGLYGVDGKVGEFALTKGAAWTCCAAGSDVYKINANQHLRWGF